MKIIRKKDIESVVTSEYLKEFYVENDMFISQEAKDYAKENGIVFIEKRGKTENRKPEHMTALNAKDLVPKNHPVIRLRGKIDTFQGMILELQVKAAEKGLGELVENLQEINDYTRRIMVAEVLSKPLEEGTLLGLNEKELRYVSQHPKEYFGIGHIAPSYKMGEICILLNSLRAGSREVELAAIDAFLKGNKVEREDILRALNRLSSAIYILYLKHLKLRKDAGEL